MPCGAVEHARVAGAGLWCLGSQHRCLEWTVNRHRAAKTENGELCGCEIMAVATAGCEIDSPKPSAVDDEGDGREQTTRQVLQTACLLIPSEVPASSCTVQ